MRKGILTLRYLITLTQSDTCRIVEVSVEFGVPGSGFRISASDVVPKREGCWARVLKCRVSLLSAATVAVSRIGQPLSCFGMLRRR